MSDTEHEKISTQTNGSAPNSEDKPQERENIQTPQNYVNNGLIRAKRKFESSKHMRRGR